MTKRTSISTRAAKALSLHIGLNAVDPDHYQGWSGELSACEFDARDMAALAKSRNMEATLLQTTAGTRGKVLTAIRSATKSLRQGDLFFLTYSGHGGQIPDITGEEADKKDETWCLYDGQLIDDELYLELARFAAGVRILVLSDSCHSGSVTRNSVPATSGTGRSKLMPPAVAMRTYRAHQEIYDRWQRQVATVTTGAASNADRDIDPDQALAGIAASPRLTALAGRFRPSSILISGCQDNQTSLDGEHNGAFTEALLRVWDHGAFCGDYIKFHGEIVARMPATQTPNLFLLGTTGSFLKQTPFTV